MQFPCRGGGQSYSACVRESLAGREPAACALSFPPHTSQEMWQEKDWEGQQQRGRVPVSVSVMRVKSLLPGTHGELPGRAGSGGRLWLQKTFICYRKAVAAVTSCRV